MKPEDFKSGNDRNLKLFLEAWKKLVERDPAITGFRSKMKEMSIKMAWKDVFQKAFNIASLDGLNTVVFHGFYYITPYQERVMQLLEQSGFNLIFLIPYDERYPYVYEIWDETYSADRGFEPKDTWHIEKSTEPDPYGEIFEGGDIKVSHQWQVHIRTSQFTSYP